MSDLIAPLNTVTFTVKRIPRRVAQRKTIQRLMRLQPHVQKGLRALQKRRRQINYHGVKSKPPAYLDERA